MHEKIAYIAIGANLPSPDGAPALQTCAQALTAIRAIEGVSGLVCSRWFSTAPVPPSGQPRYVNAVARVACVLAARGLLDQLQAIETAAGRARGSRNAARTLDLDIVDLGGEIRCAPDPVLPHPRAHLRGFVLFPLRDVAPRWMHPVVGIGIDALIASLPPEDVHTLE